MCTTTMTAVRPPELPASRSFHGRNRANETILSGISVSETQLGCRRHILDAQVPRRCGAAHVSSVRRARGLGSCSLGQGADARARATRTPGPGGRRGAAWGAGGGAARPFKPFRAAPTAAARERTTRGGARLGGGGALRGGPGS
ncbi:hypothetical protein MC885_002588 [Smutsia gigantea]|nr:hypothetical protein MC885_002588 [Smutsia gigantea]